jgi:GDP-4-dehydro-6-deoxy-D-mannose reductase
VRPEVVYHLAGWSDVGGSWAAPMDVFRVNAEGTLNVLDECRAAGVERVVSVSSADVYGIVSPDELPITEDTPMRPVSPYAVSKVAADYLGLQAWLGHGLPVLRVRAFNHIGPGQTTRFVAPAIADRVARNERDGGGTVPVGDLSPQRDFTDVRDVVRAYRLLVEHGEPGEAYNVCSGRSVAIADLAERLLARAARPMALAEDPALRRPVDVPVLRGDSTKLRDATGWEPTIELDDTLGDLLAEARARFGASGPTN